VGDLEIQPPTKRRKVNMGCVLLMVWRAIGVHLASLWKFLGARGGARLRTPIRPPLDRIPAKTSIIVQLLLSVPPVLLLSSIVALKISDKEGGSMMEFTPTADAPLLTVS
jgi:hypothetical protein